MVAHDLGGANLLSATAALLTAAGHRLSWYGAGPAAALWREAGFGVTELAADAAIGARLEERPDLLVTGTSAVSDLEREAWMAARRYQVASMAVIDAWMNYRRRMTTTSTGAIILPEAIAVADDAMRRGLKDDGLQPARVYEVGQPHLEALIARLATRRKTRVRNARRLLVFFSEGILEQYDFGCRPGYDQFTAMSLLLKSFYPPSDVELAILPHPLEGVALWQPFIADAKHSGRVFLSLGGRDRDAALCAADGVIGMTSMVLIEAALLGIPVLSVQPDRVENSNPMLDKFPGIALVTAPSAVPEALDRFVTMLDHSYDPPSLPVIANAAERFAAAIESELALARAAS